MCLLRDKYLFYKYLSSFNIPTPKVFAVYKFGKLYDTELNEIKEEILYDKNVFFLKDIGGQCASFVKHIKNYDDFCRVKPTLNGCYILQEALKQNEILNKLNPYAINTLRIVTAINEYDEPYVFSSVLRIGTSKTGNVDNWAAGGIAVGVSDCGNLKNIGFYKKNEKTTVHPDTGVLFSEFSIPEYHEAVNLVLHAHKCFYGIKVIGWDVAFTENGPFIIEGNDNWEISLMQACNGGLKDKWNMI